MLRSRSKTANVQSPSNKPNKSKPTSKFKKYGTLLLQILIFLVLLYASWFTIVSQMDKDGIFHPINESLESIYLEEAIANELLFSIETHDDNDDSLEDMNTNEEPVDEFSLLPNDDCDWRPDNLVGTCFGLKFITDIESAIECKKACCENEECVTWQHHPTKGCQNGGNVRLGMERASTSNWCEPTKPMPWSGRRIKQRNDGKCEWETEEANTQCFGLGSQWKEIKSLEECAKLCCANNEKECELYQWRDDKGCFIGRSHNCDSDILSYIGQRKMVFDN